MSSQPFLKWPAFTNIFWLWMWVFVNSKRNVFVSHWIIYPTHVYSENFKCRRILERSINFSLVFTYVPYLWHYVLRVQKKAQLMHCVSIVLKIFAITKQFYGMKTFHLEHKSKSMDRINNAIQTMYFVKYGSKISCLAFSLLISISEHCLMFIMKIFLPNTF